MGTIRLLKSSVIVVGLALLAACGPRDKGQQKTATTEEAVGEEKVVSKIQLDEEECQSAIELFERYLHVSQAYADSAAANVEMIAASAIESYQRNKVHVDSVLHDCIRMAKQGNYDKVLATLEEERENIYVHPGNLVDNEIDLMLLFSKFYNQVYYTSEQGFYKKMMPHYDHLLLHMEMMEKLGKGKHQDYDVIKLAVDYAKKVLDENRRKG